MCLSNERVGARQPPVEQANCSYLGLQGNHNCERATHSLSPLRGGWLPRGDASTFIFINVAEFPLYFNTLILMLGRFASGLFAHASKAAQARAAVTVPTIGIASAVLYSSVQPVCLQPSYTRPSFEERMKPKAQPVVLTKIEKNSGNEESSETESTEEEESAFDERTGEINWDCPLPWRHGRWPMWRGIQAGIQLFRFLRSRDQGYRLH